MISLSTALARVNRAKIKELAKPCYLHADSVEKNIGYFKNRQLAQPLFGIYASSALWTVVSVNWLYSCVGGEITKLQIDQETQILFQYFTQNDFNEYGYLEGSRVIWMHSNSVCSQILNVLLLLEKVPNGTLLKH
ncbi:hypothetical protein L1077_26210 [Pseudoalteromonas luteoviolacea]|uniref:hypothetical protein n=1 Tax=Pseudoalteromonas luteoviolacea TaxID=43657 RepID=UPI001F276C98|nr:hypothetical protein [Pseudoalteromonas luteoviolacea]MCF6442922.1 hypothetical protein [Pseudoalteromonas luteoviolacea]